MSVLSLEDVQRAREVLGDSVRNTPLKRSTTLSAMTGADLYLKLENFQRTGSFKVRGALNKIHSLTDEERARGVVAASAGNHAQGVAFAASQAGVQSDIFMPADAALAKAIATRGYGATVHLVGEDYQEAYEHARAFQEEQGSTFVHAFDDQFIMAGQGTLGLEVIESLPELDVLLVPIGGGGLIGGVATAIKAIRPTCRIIGVQAEGASSVAASLQKGHVVPLSEVHTMADGIACRRLGELTFQAIRDHVDEVVTVDETEIAAAILFLLERAKIVAEGAGAVALAAVMHGHAGDLSGKTVCALISGGNIDMTLLGRIIQRGLVKGGRIAEIDTTVPDRPGEIARLLNHMAENRANVLDIHHDRLRTGVPLHRTGIELHIETKGPEHVKEIMRVLKEAGYDAVLREE